jgi:PST family polysaccharide transporter
VLFSKLLLCLFSFISLVILVLAIPMLREHASLYLAGFTVVVGQALFVNWFFQGIEKMQFVAWLTLLARLIFAALVFGFIKEKGDAGLYLFFMGLGSLLAGLISIYTAGRFFGVHYVKPGRQAIAGELRAGWPVMMANLAGYGCQYGNIFILRFFTNDLIVGYYGMAERIFFTARQVLVAYSQASYPQVCRVVSQGTEGLLSYLKKNFLPFLLVMSFGFLLMFIFSPALLSFFLPGGYEHAVTYLRVFCIAGVFICLNIPATLALLAMDQGKKYSLVISLAWVFNVFLNLVLANFFGATGTVAAILLTELFIMAGLNYRLSRIVLTRGALNTA